MSADQAPRPTGGPGVTRFAARGEQRLSYESSGPADGVPILGLHDLLADRGQLRPLGDGLPRDRFRLIMPDARGHGASPLISGRAYPVGELAADALAVLDAEGVVWVHVAAVGWGAGIALGLALTAPDRVASLVLAQPYLPALFGQAEPLEVLRQAADAAEKGQTDRALDLYASTRLGPGWREGLPKARLGAMRRAAASLAPLLAGTTEATFAKAAFAPLATPVTLLATTNGPLVERESVAALTDLLTGARVETLALADAAPLSERELLAAISRAILAQARG